MKLFNEIFVYGCKNPYFFFAQTASRLMKWIYWNRQFRFEHVMNGKFAKK